MKAKAGRGMTRLKKFRDLRGHRARHHAGAEFEHVDLKSLGTGGSGKFQADKTCADHDDATARGKLLPQRLAIVEDSQIPHVFEIGIGNIEQPIARTCRQHQMAVVERRTGGEPQFAIARSIAAARSAINSMFWSR